jgi:uncharacterized membrane protein (DUF485 family)
MSDLLKPIQPFLTLGTNLCLVFYVVFVCALMFWIWRDAKRRGAMSFFWAVAVIPFSVLTWMIYMIVRPPETLDELQERDIEIAAREAELAMYGSTCPNCFKPVQSDYLICPTCMKKLKKPCGSCGRAIKTSYSVCPYCKAKQSPVEADGHLPERPAWPTDQLGETVPDEAPAVEEPTDTAPEA